MSNSHNDYEVFNALLQKFLSLPKTNSNPTFMDICQMGGDRFEERCSQILRFFLTPNAAHGLRDLFLSSLLEVTGKEDLSFSLNGTKVITEEATEDRKFIDITVVADDFVIAIENKIGASLYNPLWIAMSAISIRRIGRKPTISLWYFLLVLSLMHQRLAR